MTTAKELNEELESLKQALSQRELSQADLDELASEIARLKDLLTPHRKKHSILELQGLGKEYWRSIDVEEYLRKERESWD